MTSMTEEAQAIVNGQRQDDYGNINDSFQRIAGLWSAYTGFIIDKQGWYSIGCSGCGCEPGFCVRSQEEAIKKWNSRVVFSEELEFQAGIEWHKRYLIDLLS